LGSVLYGYSRVFAASGELDPSFKRVLEPHQATAAALAVRHVAITVIPEPASDQALTVHPDLGITQSLDDIRTSRLLRQPLKSVVLQNAALDASYQSFLYPTLWRPLRVLARLIEWTLETITTQVRNPAIAVLIFAVLFRAVSMPLSIWSTRQQRRFFALQNEMKPTIERIKQNYKGAERSEKILQAYEAYGFSPLAGLKSSAALFIQLPVLIALFAVTTESALFRDAPFLWISDLSMPDGVLGLPFNIPLLGDQMNLLPVALGIVSVIATQAQRRMHASASPRTGLFLALLFVVLFYSCAAALVLYWLTVNAVQIIEGLCMRQGA
jgi:YidC/Oxa1 family membrane protein insertase